MGTTKKRHKDSIKFTDYRGEAADLDAMMRLVGADLSEPYSIFTYRYFLRNWPELCVLARDGEANIIAVAVSKVDEQPGEAGHVVKQGYIAMLAVDPSYRRAGLGTGLVARTIERMRDMRCDSVMLEAEATNLIALGLYEKLGFARAERLYNYYLNGADAFRLKLLLTEADLW